MCVCVWGASVAEATAAAAGICRSESSDTGKGRQKRTNKWSNDLCCGCYWRNHLPIRGVPRLRKAAIGGDRKRALSVPVAEAARLPGPPSHARRSAGETSKQWSNNGQIMANLLSKMVKLSKWSNRLCAAPSRGSAAGHGAMPGGGGQPSQHGKEWGKKGHVRKRRGPRACSARAPWRPRWPS